MGAHDDIHQSWLEARAQLDDAARDDALCEAAWSRLPHGGHVLDFGGGTGNAALTHRAQPWGRWTVLERNAALASAVSADGRHVSWLHSEFPDEASLAAMASADLIHASAVLDMLTESQLIALIDAARTNAVTLYAPLNVLQHTTGDGTTEDAERLAEYDAHMSRNSEHGGPLGPAWRDVWRRACPTAGVRSSPSMWRVGSESGDALAFIAGFLRDGHSDAAGLAWCADFEARLRLGSVALDVHHEDVLLE
ncbi:MAG: SAM-dependent methyltransferase [Bradymonadia bacterium]|jgi:SAM-dependent methyltransferase